MVGLLGLGHVLLLREFQGLAHHVVLVFVVEVHRDQQVVRFVFLVHTAYLLLLDEGCYLTRMVFHCHGHFCLIHDLVVLFLSGAELEPRGVLIHDLVVCLNVLHIVWQCCFSNGSLYVNVDIRVLVNTDGLFERV